MATCFDCRPFRDLDRSLLDDTFSTTDLLWRSNEGKEPWDAKLEPSSAGVATSPHLAMNFGMPLAPGLGLGPTPAFVTGAAPVFIGAEVQAAAAFPGLLPHQPVPANGLGLVSGPSFEGFPSGDILTMEAKAKLMKNPKQPKQQAANKVSQQRYRERKKAKQHEMEETIVQLQQMLHELQGLQRRNHLLEGANTDLEAKLVEQEREIEQLKFTLGRQSDPGLDPAAAPACAGDAAAATLPGAADPAMAFVVACCADSAAVAGRGSITVCCAPLARDLSEIDFSAEFEKRMGELRAGLERAGLRDGDPAGTAALSRDTLAEISQLVSRCCQLRQAAMAAEGAKALALFEGGSKWVSGLEVDAGRWASVIQALHLNEDQQEQLLLLRQAHLAKLRTIYQARQDLNLEAMALMLPRQSPLLQQDTTIEGKLANMGSSGHLAITRGNMVLASLLDRVKGTMRREQRAVMELNLLAISKILTPVQAGLYMVRTYPELGDILALVNALARHLGQDELPGARCGACAAQLCQGEGGEGPAVELGDACGYRLKSFAQGEGAILSGRVGSQGGSQCLQHNNASAGTCCKGGGGGGASAKSGSCSIGEAGAPPAPADPAAAPVGCACQPAAAPAAAPVGGTCQPAAAPAEACQQAAAAGGNGQPGDNSQPASAGPIGGQQGTGVCCRQGAGASQTAAGGCCKRRAEGGQPAAGGCCKRAVEGGQPAAGGCCQAGAKRCCKRERTP